MGKDTGIGWAHATFNGGRGCEPVSEECESCYARDQVAVRNPAVLGRWGSAEQGGTRVIAAEKYWREPLKWNGRPILRCTECKADGVGEHSMEIVKGRWDFECPYCHCKTFVIVPRRVFCESLGDLFEDWDGPMVDHNEERLFWPHNAMQSKTLWIPESECGGGEPPVTMDDLRKRTFDLMAKTPFLAWLVLTKRPENIQRFWVPHGDSRYRANVWLGTTIGLQSSMKRIIELHGCRELTPVLWLSCEPLLGPLDLEYPEDLNKAQICCNGFECGCRGLPCEPPLLMGIDWLIAGGESGSKARIMDPAWARSVRDQCERWRVPFFFKQWGEYAPLSALPDDVVDHEAAKAKWPVFNLDGTPGEVGRSVVYRAGVYKTGRKLDGVIHDAIPEVFVEGVVAK